MPVQVSLVQICNQTDFIYFSSTEKLFSKVTVARDRRSNCFVERQEKKLELFSVETQGGCHCPVQVV